MHNQNSLNSKDSRILMETFSKYNIIPDNVDYYNFWNWEVINLNGDYTIQEIKCFCEAMQLMGKRHITSRST